MKGIPRDGKKGNADKRMQQILSALRKAKIWPDVEGRALSFCYKGFSVFLVDKVDGIFVSIEINPLSEEERAYLIKGGMSAAKRKTRLLKEYRIAGDAGNAAREVIGWLKEAAKAQTRVGNYIPLHQN